MSDDESLMMRWDPPTARQSSILNHPSSEPWCRTEQRRPRAAAAAECGQRPPARGLRGQRPDGDGGPAMAAGRPGSAHGRTGSPLQVG